MKPASAVISVFFGSSGNISCKWSRSLEPDGPVLQAHGNPVPTCQNSVNHIWGLLAFLEIDSWDCRFTFRDRLPRLRFPCFRDPFFPFFVFFRFGEYAASFATVRGSSIRLPSPAMTTNPAIFQCPNRSCFN